MNLILFILGLIIGFIVSRVCVSHLSAFGSFRLEPYDNEDIGFYKVNMMIVPNQNLLKKDYIILKKDNSQK